MTYAIYFELADSDNSTMQGLFIPYFDLVNRSYYPTIWSRTVTPDTPSRTWAHATNREYYPIPDDGEPGTIAGNGMYQLAGISSHMKGFFSPASFELRGSLPVFLTNNDKLELLEKSDRLPVNLHTSIRLARNLSHWPELPSPLRVGVI